MEWSVHAQLTFSHNGPPGGMEPPTVTSFCSADGGLRMEYTFRGRATSPQRTAPEYNFQRGNMVFTSRPPARQGGRSRSFNAGSDSAAAAGANATSTLVVGGGGRSGSQPPCVQAHDSSGYSSEQQYNSLPSRQPARQHAYDRRCMSTASITLVQPEFPPLPEHPSRVGRRKEVRDAEAQTVTPVPQPKNKTSATPRMGAKAYNSRRKTDSDVLLQVPTLQLPESEFEPRNKVSMLLFTFNFD